MDDEQDLREILSLLLEKMGYCVDSAKEGDEAIGLARDAITAGQPYVVAILDLKVPCGRGGRETAQALLELDSNLKVIASSGYSEDPIMSNPTRYGFAARLIKPYGINDLSLAIESMDSHPGVVGKGEKVFQPCLL
jgi:DNA-binding NtrC family response regulator